LADATGTSQSAELVHIALGGTISMRIVNGLAVPTLSGAELAGLAGITTTPVEIATVGGPQLNFGLLAAAAEAITAAQARGVGSVVITLGTDAIEEVGAFLAYCGPWDCNVVITGAMAAGAEPGSDGPQNLRDAAAVASGELLSEPVVVFAGRVTLARATVKVSGLELDAFASPTQRSWSVEEVLANRSLPGADPPPPLLGPPGAHTVEVPIIVSALSIAGPRAPEPPSAGGLRPAGAQPAALVCVGTGAGNLNAEVCEIAEAALAAGATVAIATRAQDLRMSAGYGYPGGSGRLAAAGAVLATGMSPYRARIFLLIGLSQGLRGVALSSRLTSHVDALRMLS
jgi:L-asparaginase